MEKLTQAIEEITEIAKGFGLDFFPMRYEICPPEIIYTFGAYGMPTRYNHWSFGKSFHKMKLQYDLGMSKIYELVINSNPCYAFLLDSNTLIQNKLIVAHVLAHCDFFKNNAHFAHTNRNMVDSMAASADRIRQYEKKYGRSKVEAFLDAAMAISEHIDPYADRIKKAPTKDKNTKSRTLLPYEDLWDLEPAVGDEHFTASSSVAAGGSSTGYKSIKDMLRDHRAQKAENSSSQVMDPEKDLLLFIMNHNQQLEDWQRDILTIVRDEMQYFWPQIETKIMNEGWASFWHTRILREMDLSDVETIEFAKLNASVIQPSTTQLNPYYLGLKMFEDIEKRFGRDHMFEVRELESDVSFIRNYLTHDLVKEMDMYTFGKMGNEYVVNGTEWEKVRDTLVDSRMNGGFPYITVVHADRELYLRHHYEGVELDIRYLEKTLPYVYHLWGRSVHIETKLEERNVLFSYDGEKVHRKFI
ncbi:SpoVR family protein [Ammoniphilus sp. CFH 90114]|uniref:SpoVR family protein n=1 Tax=Ammoniphilus sp. CFH 90114 TaxID=2493665 RepID=UPI00100E7E88|nr:SpoVR family protein [Ammoniphilus sp. CFH 90114]RXT14911.1 SpoVR family protein [Ammoniphilus sp. CFH 90114]